MQYNSNGPWRWTSLYLLLLVACHKDPSFSSDVVQGPVPITQFSYQVDPVNPRIVTFANTSTHAQSYYWQFGDGDVSTEAAPVHRYAASGKYRVILKTASSAGYTHSDTSTVISSLPATADFDFNAFLLQTTFINNATGVESVVWDFGDNSSSTSIAPMHEFPAAGTYEVKLTVTGLTGNVVTKSKTVTVKGFKNLIKGGDFEASSAQYWSAYQNNNPPTWGYTAVVPKGGIGGCLRFASFQNASNSTNQLMYQAVQVEAGKQYRISAVIKAPEGGFQCYFQFFVSSDAAYWQDADPPGGNQVLSLNTWHGWGNGSNYSVAVDGDLYTAVLANGKYGSGATNGGIYTATKTGTVYVGVQAGTWSGKSNGDWLVDNLAFEVL